MHGEHRMCGAEHRGAAAADRKSTRPNSSHANIPYAVFFVKVAATNSIYTLSLPDAVPIFVAEDEVAAPPVQLKPARGAGGGRRLRPEGWGEALSAFRRPVVGMHGEHRMCGAEHRGAAA